MLFILKCSYFHNLKYFLLSLNVLIRVMNHDDRSTIVREVNSQPELACVCTR